LFWVEDPHNPLREIADPKQQGSAPAGEKPRTSPTGVCAMLALSDPPPICKLKRVCAARPVFFDEPLKAVPNEEPVKPRMHPLVTVGAQAIVAAILAPVAR
jgi:hypothetical protein